MKLNKREKLLLAALILVTVLAAYYLLIFKPQTAKIEALQAQTAVYEKKLALLKEISKPDYPLYLDFTVMDNKVKNATAVFFPVINQEKMITILEEKFIAAGVNPTAVTFEGKAVAPLEEKLPELSKTVNVLAELKSAYVNKEPIQGKAEEAPAKSKGKSDPDPIFASVQKLGVTVNYVTGYEQLVAFIKSLEADQRRIIVDNITCVKGIDNTLTGSISLSFYALPKMHEQDDDFYRWSFNNPYGKSNPFTPFSGYAVPQAGTTAAVPGRTGDFSMMVNPIYSDLTTIILGKMGDRSSMTYVYADNPGFENVEIQFVQKDNKYYYRYKTSRESYPKDYAQLAGFVPGSNNIVLDIYSISRSEKGDLDGASLKLINSTNLKLVVNVHSDDSSSPRVKFAQSTGDIQINRM